MVEERPDRVERRLAAILAADLAGYSRLMGIDEAGTAGALSEHRAAIDAQLAKHRGRIVKTTGDGRLIEFPSLVDAVECAVSVQTVMVERNADMSEDRRMLFRVVIDLGDVLVQGDIIHLSPEKWQQTPASPTDKLPLEDMQFTFAVSDRAGTYMDTSTGKPMLIHETFEQANALNSSGRWRFAE